MNEGGCKYCGHAWGHTKDCPIFESERAEEGAESAEGTETKAETKEMSVGELTGALVQQIENRVEEMRDGLAPSMVEDTIIEFLVPVAEQYGVNPEEVDVAELAGLRVKTRTERSDLPGEYDSVEASTVFAEYFIGGESVLMTSAGGDYYAGSLDKLDEAALGRAVEQFIEKLKSRG